MISSKTTLVAESEQLRSAMLADIETLQITSSKLAARARAWTFVAASSLALITGAALVTRRYGASKTTRPCALMPSPLLSIGLVTGLWISSRFRPRQRDISTNRPSPQVCATEA